MSLRQRLGNLIWPIILIAAGAILLLANLNILQADLWQVIVDLWPLLVVAAALNMFLVGGSIFLPLVLLGFALAFLAANFGLVDWQMWEALGRLWPLILVGIGLDVLITARLFGGGGRVEEIHGPLEGAVAADVRIEPGVGKFSLTAGSAGDALYSGAAHLAAGEQVQHSVQRRQGEARVRIKQSAQWFFPFSAAWSAQRGWDLNLNPTIPTRLKIDGGLGPRHLDLRGLNLTRLRVDGGVGASQITLPAQGQLDARIDGGLGDTTVRIPAGVGARVHVDSGLGNRRVHGEFRQEGKYYLTPTYETAAHRLDLKVDQGLGSLTIVRE